VRISTKDSTTSKLWKKNFLLIALPLEAGIQKSAGNMQKELLISNATLIQTRSFLKRAFKKKVEEESFLCSDPLC
jgi:hypothetical protein